MKTYVWGYSWWWKKIRFGAFQLWCYQKFLKIWIDIISNEVLRRMGNSSSTLRKMGKRRTKWLDRSLSKKVFLLEGSKMGGNCMGLEWSTLNNWFSYRISAGKELLQTKLRVNNRRKINLIRPVISFRSYCEWWKIWVFSLQFQTRIHILLQSIHSNDWMKGFL